MIEGQENVGWEDWTALAGACEEHGIPGLYRSDHYKSFAETGERAALDAWGTLCGLAALTSRIRLGTMVSPTSFRHPSVLAKLAVTADHVSGGRIDLGIGAGWNEAEHAAFGFSFHDLKTRMDIFEEQVEIVAGLLGPEPFAFEGEHYRLAEDDARPKPVNGRLPLILGGAAGKRGARIAARWADEYNTVGVGPDECRARRERLAAACEAAGRDPSTQRFSLMTGTLVGRDEAELHDRARALAELQGQAGREPAELVAELRSSGWVAGVIDDAAEQLRALAGAGVERVLCQLLLHRDLDQVAVIGRELAPLVR